ncbi:MAPK regulated corepressor interacting protein 2-like isoform X2 [Zootermopsis nevadensis]|uniref:MAPK regulated corepressor interacting protein 2-like isoform X2 n=1 Tax=Zootermopsis nevadensis TaxID=136037 RepID=UPI000B8E5205|nr:MAPK regulated corepressor interacting protein 2-like isoform X2 [Zootermopsis nevadensis]
MSLPRAQMQSLNGKRQNSQRMQQETSPTQHDDLIRYICESWNTVSRELENFSQNGADTNKDFEPFDLEAWWGKRVVQNITRTQSS